MNFSNMQGIFDQLSINEITNIYIYDLKGSSEVANELLDFTVDKLVPAKLHKIKFDNWQGSPFY